jgi:hypothetical protein
MKTLLDKIVLDNGLTAEVWDRSRAIAADTTKVELYVCIPITLERKFFPSDEPFETVRRIWGETLLFEYVNERTFVYNDARTDVFSNLLADFRDHTLPYLGRPGFARGVALSKYREFIGSPHKYRNLPT